MIGDILVNLHDIQYNFDFEFLTSFVHSLGVTLKKYPEVLESDCFSMGQLKSKAWLAEQLSNESFFGYVENNVFICAGWYGMLAPFLFASDIPIDKIRSFDIDPKCEEIADSLNRKHLINEWKFKASTMDIMDMEYPTDYSVYRRDGSVCNTRDMPTIIINTSCEHLTEFDKWFDKIPKGIIIALQSNNFFEAEGHVNCVNSLDEFKKMAPMAYTYEGVLDLPDYKRFMLIGRK